MPPNPIAPLTSAAVLTNFPFKLTATTVKDGAIQAGMNDLNCGCPGWLLPNNPITPGDNVLFTTSQNLFGDLLTDAQKQQNAAALGQSQAKAKQGVIIYKESYLFRGLYPSERQQQDDTTINDYGTYDEDPVIRIYGLDTPIVTQDFFAGLDPSTTETVKIWLTVCFPSGETTQPTTFSTCAQKTRNDNQTDVASNAWRSLLPQVAFISYGMQLPSLVQARTVDKSVGNQNPPSPRIERRQVTAHIPIGEVDVNGKVVQQYIKSHLMLQDICFNGTPSKVPYPVFSTS